MRLDLSTGNAPIQEKKMASDGSVAPKERVNIVYRPATGDAQAEVELPLKLLVVGDYTLRDDDTPVEEMKPINVDKDNFNDVLKAQKLSLNMTVPMLDEFMSTPVAVQRALPAANESVMFSELPGAL